MKYTYTSFSSCLLCCTEFDNVASMADDLFSIVLPTSTWLIANGPLLTLIFSIGESMNSASSALAFKFNIYSLCKKRNATAVSDIRLATIAGESWFGGVCMFGNSAHVLEHVFCTALVGVVVASIFPERNNVQNEWA